MLGGLQATMKKAAESDEYKGIIGYTEDQVVSTDFQGDARSVRMPGPNRQRARQRLCCGVLSSGGAAPPLLGARAASPPRLGTTPARRRWLRRS